MRIAVNESNGQDEHQNQIIGNINYNQNSMFLYKKTIFETK